LLKKKGSILLFVGGYKQFSNLVSISSCVEGGAQTVTFFTTTVYSEVALLMLYMAQQAKRELCCSKLDNCEHDAGVLSEYGSFGKSKSCSLALGVIAFHI
jgi:hypothetical protein